jgi:hypothetical protein
MRRTMEEANATDILNKLDHLRTELVELAYTLEIRGQMGAADVALTTAARIGELCEELAAAR